MLPVRLVLTLRNTLHPLNASALDLFVSDYEELRQTDRLARYQ